MTELKLKEETRSNIYAIASIFFAVASFYSREPIYNELLDEFYFFFLKTFYFKLLKLKNSNNIE